MYRHNFLFHRYPGSCYTAGRPFTIEVPRPGKYKLTMVLTAERPLERVSVRTGSGSLIFTGSVPAGVFRHVTVVHVGNSVPEGCNRVCQNREITVTVTAETDCLSSLSVSEISCPTIYIAGSADRITAADSGAVSEPGNGITTAADSRIATGSIPGAGQPTARSSFHTEKSSPARWEQMLAAYTDQRIAVSDCSHSGVTMESFRKAGYYAAIHEYGRPGDFYFFQFAPGGQTAEDWAPGGSCRRQLARYVIECRERLAYPVLLTPAAHPDRDDTDDCSRQLWNQCLDAYREVSDLTDTPVIEFHRLCDASYDAYATAGSVAREIARICGSYPEKRYRFLAKCMRTNCG